jgi:hypothetical protein
MIPFNSYNEKLFDIYTCKKCGVEFLLARTKEVTEEDIKRVNCLSACLGVVREHDKTCPCCKSRRILKRVNPYDL